MKLKEELDLKLKVELHELEERKNLHINELINNHQKSFDDLKKYYNEITAENLALIKYFSNLELKKNNLKKHSQIWTSILRSYR